MFLGVKKSKKKNLFSVTVDDLVFYTVDRSFRNSETQKM